MRTFRPTFSVVSLLRTTPSTLCSGDSDTDFYAGTDGEHGGGGKHLAVYHNGPTRIEKEITAGQLKSLRSATSEAQFNDILDVACGTQWINALPEPTEWREAGWNDWLPAEKNALP